jgi:hypothetical protein
VRKLNSRTLRNLATQLLAKFGSVIGVDLSVEACARDGNVSEAGVEQVWVDAGIAVNEDAFGSKALGAIAPRCVRANRLCGTEHVSGLFCSARHLHWQTYLAVRGMKSLQPEACGISRLLSANERNSNGSQEIAEGDFLKTTQEIRG